MAAENKLPDKIYIRPEKLFFRLADEIGLLETGATKIEDAICDLMSVVEGTSKIIPVDELQYQDSLIQSLNCLKQFFNELAGQVFDGNRIEISKAVSGLPLNEISKRLAEKE